MKTIFLLVLTLAAVLGTGARAEDDIDTWLKHVPDPAKFGLPQNVDSGWLYLRALTVVAERKKLDGLQKALRSSEFAGLVTSPKDGTLVADPAQVRKALVLTGAASSLGEPFEGGGSRYSASPGALAKHFAASAGDPYERYKAYEGTFRYLKGLGLPKDAAVKLAEDIADSGDPRQTLEKYRAAIAKGLPEAADAAALRKLVNGGAASAGLTTTLPDEVFSRLDDTRVQAWRFPHDEHRSREAAAKAFQEKRDREERAAAKAKAAVAAKQAALDEANETMTRNVLVGGGVLLSTAAAVGWLFRLRGRRATARAAATDPCALITSSLDSETPPQPASPRGRSTDRTVASDGTPRPAESAEHWDMTLFETPSVREEVRPPRTGPDPEFERQMEEFVREMEAEMEQPRRDGATGPR